ncbi:MAG: YkgJ family cysteine cluster protein [Kofleriaceae bacterium]
MARTITHRYIDPLSEVWLGAARRIGLRVVRTQHAYAASDGAGTLAIATDDQLDADDSLAQMIFHELCHSLVEGEESFTAADWGMNNTSSDHDWREHACLRVQWLLTGRYGLRGVFAPTTEFRAFWDQLAGDVLADRSDVSVQAAITGVRRAGHPPWAPALTEALAATAAMAAAASAFTKPTPGEPPTLWSTTSPVRAPHPSGLPAGDTAETCGSCAWRYTARGTTRCRQADAKIDDAWRGCERYESALDCQTCGACCRAAYHSVEVSPRDPVVKRQPSLIVDRGSYLEIQRTGDRCAALHGGVIEGEHQQRFHCAIYDDRPRTCRDFTLGSAHCLTARRRVGLSL